MLNIVPDNIIAISFSDLMLLCFTLLYSTLLSIDCIILHHLDDGNMNDICLQQLYEIGPISLLHFPLQYYWEQSCTVMRWIPGPSSYRWLSVLTIWKKLVPFVLGAVQPQHPASACPWWLEDLHNWRCPTSSDDAVALWTMTERENRSHGALK